MRMRMRMTMMMIKTTIMMDMMKLTAIHSSAIPSFRLRWSPEPEQEPIGNKNKYTWFWWWWWSSSWRRLEPIGTILTKRTNTHDDDDYDDPARFSKKQGVQGCQMWHSDWSSFCWSTRPDLLLELAFLFDWQSKYSSAHSVPWIGNPNSLEHIIETEKLQL